MTISIIMPITSYKEMIADPNTLLHNNVWVGQERSNNSLLDDGALADGEVVVQVTVDSVYFANDVLKLKKRVIPA